VLYRDILILRGPFEIFMPAFLMKLFGMHIGVLNAYFYLGTVATLFIYVLFALRLYKTRGFVYLFALVLIARTFPWSCFNVWGGIRFGLGISGILMAVNFLKNRKTWNILFSGILTSIAFWTSFELGAFSFISIITALILYGYLEMKDMRAAFKYVLIYIAGNIVILLPFILYLFLHNAFSCYVDTIYVVLTKMTKVFDQALCFETPIDLKEFLMAFSPLSHNFKYTVPFLFYMAVGVYLFQRFAKRKSDVSDIAILALAIYGILLYKGAFRDIEGPQYRMALQPLLLIMFFYLEHIYIRLNKAKESVQGLKKVFVIFILLIIPFYAVGFSVVKYAKRFFIFKEAKQIILYNKHAGILYADPNPMPVQILRAKGIIVPSAQAEEIDGVVKYIISNTREGESVFAFPDLGTYNFLADRPPVGRFYSADFSFMDSKWFEEMFEELKNSKPRFIICAKEFSRLKPFMPTVGRYIETIDHFLQENYEIRKSFSTVNVLERN
jgi:hypothetical protein